MQSKILSPFLISLLLSIVFLTCACIIGIARVSITLEGPSIRYNTPIRRIITLTQDQLFFEKLVAGVGLEPTTPKV